MNASTYTWSIVAATMAAISMAAMASAALIVLLRPFLLRYALARPNARSSHREPVPQGGGIAVVGATILVSAGVIVFFPEIFFVSSQLFILLVAIIGLAVVGLTDDLRPLEAAPRLLLQAFAVALIIATLPADMRLVHILPWWAERGLLLVGGVWFVNLVNFMDGLDWMTVVEVVPVSAGLALFGLMGALPPDATFIALALCGATIGFAPFNRPVARLFLGDVGSLPIGLLLGWMLILLAGRGHLAASLLLPLYYLADATITLLRRLRKGEVVTQAHRSHFYQRAMDGGLGANTIVSRVFAANILLVAFATATIMSTSLAVHLAMLAAGMALVGILLWSFAANR